MVRNIVTNLSQNCDGFVTIIGHNFATKFALWIGISVTKL